MTTYRILVVDDETGWKGNLQECLIEALAEVGHEPYVLDLTDFQEARIALKNEPWHLLVTDINLQGFRKKGDKFGIQLIQIAYELNVPRIAISGDKIVEPEDVGKIFTQYHAHDYFGKLNFERERFKGSVQRALGIVTDESSDIPRTPQTSEDVEKFINNWQVILDSQATLNCYAFFLVLPADREAIGYITEQGAELDLISRESWFIIALSEQQYWGSGFSKEWAKKVRRYVYEGFSVKVAQMLKVDLTDFPCLVLFQDITSSRRIVISLKGLSSAEIGETMRLVAKSINDAANKGEDPLVTVQRSINREARRKANKAIASKVTVLAGKTFEEGIKILISELGKMINPS